MPLFVCDNNFAERLFRKVLRKVSAATCHSEPVRQLSMNPLFGQLIDTKAKLYNSRRRSFRPLGKLLDHVDNVMSCGEQRVAACISLTQSSSQHLPLSTCKHMRNAYVRPSVCFSLELVAEDAACEHPFLSMGTSLTDVAAWRTNCSGSRSAWLV